MNSGKKRGISLGILFALGTILGALCFIIVYGIKVLDFTNTGWLFLGDNDLRQHYIAWCHYRNDPWHFPIGLIDTLSYPHSMSVIYTDSIPCFAVLFKLFSRFLPVTFQYFGLFGILSFALMGGFSCVLLARFIQNRFAVLVLSLFYILSFPVIHRMYYHTALASQWIIIACLCLWVYDECIASKVKKVIYWALIGFMCVAVHSYFLPMCAMILAALMVCQWIKGNKKTAIFEFAAFCIAGLFNLYILGGFYGGTSASGLGLGTFGSNLNTFVNPNGLGSILPTLPLYYDFQYEGMAYLGAGIIFMLIITIVAALIFIRRKVTIAPFHSDNLYARITIGLVAVSILAATLPLISFNDIKIIQIPYPGFVEKILGIFRSNGRLIWVAYYIILTIVISMAYYILERYKWILLSTVVACVMLQVTDMSASLLQRHEYFTADHFVSTLWEEPELSALAEGKSEFIFLYTDNDITLMSAYYGYLNNIRQNNYYYARDIEGLVQQTIDDEYKQLGEIKLKKDAVYIITEEEYAKNSEFYEMLPADFVLMDSHVFFTAGTEL